MDLAERVIAAVAPHPAVRDIRFVGSRADGHAVDLSDWDFLVETDDFEAVAQVLPFLLEPLEPLAQQWDRLSSERCWMLIVPGPAKIDLIFASEPHTDEPPWQPNRDNLGAIDAHFWDWMLWLRAKEAGGKLGRVAIELDKLFEHLLAPLGVQRRPSSVSEALAGYRAARERAEQRFGVVVPRELEAAVAPAFEQGSATHQHL
jgi:predicted nucleotidyltransferase